MTVKQYTLSQITAELGGEVRGEDVSVCAVRPLAQAGVEHISFLANPKYKHEVHDSKAGAVIVSDKAAGEFTGRSLIVAADPYLYFAKVARLFSPVVKARGGIHPTAVVEPSATVPNSCEIGANAYIGAIPYWAKAAASWRMPSSSMIANWATKSFCTLMLWFITAARSATASKSTAARSSARTVSALPSPATRGSKSRKPAR